MSKTAFTRRLMAFATLLALTLAVIPLDFAAAADTPATAATTAASAAPPAAAPPAAAPLAGAAPAAAKSSTPTEAERKELITWTSLENGKGALLTPPIGAHSSEATRIRKYVAKIVETLAGDRLRAEGIHLVINIYASTDVNAWMQQFDPKIESSPEAKWLAANPGTTWPIRRWLGFEKDSKPFFELGVTTGLINSLEFEAELAFVLGHELTHLFEGHTNAGGDVSESVKRWWSSQSNEAVADHGGIEKILGKYELSGALIALSRLHKAGGKEATEFNISDALGSGTAAHHHEGVRIGLAQVEIENLRHFNPKAVPMELTQIPVKLKLGKASRPAGPDPEFARDSWKILEVMRDYFFLDRTYTPLLNEDEKYPLGTEKRPNPLDGIIGHAKPDQLAVFIMQAFNEIDQAKISKKLKVNAFLQLNMLLHREGGYYVRMSEVWAAIGPQGIAAIERFLLRNTSGTDGWRYEDFAPIAAKVDRYEDAIVDMIFLKSASTQGMLKRLKTISPEWQRYFEAQSNLRSLDRPEMFLTKVLYNKIDGLFSYPEGPLLNEHKNSLLTALANVETQKLFKQEWQPGFPAFLLIVNLTGKGEPTGERAAIAVDLQKANAKHMAAFERQYIDQVVNSLMSKTATHNEKFARLFSLDSALDTMSLSDAQEKRLSTALATVAIETYLKRPAASDSVEDSSEELFRIFDALFISLSRELVGPVRSPSEKLAIAKFLAMYQATSLGYFRKGRNSEAAANLNAYFSNLSKADLMNAIMSSVPSVETEIKWFEQFYPENRESRDFATQMLKKMAPDEKEWRKMANKTMEWRRLLVFNWAARANMLRLMTLADGEVPAALKTLNMSEFTALLGGLEQARVWAARAWSFRNNLNLSAGQSGVHRDAGEAIVQMFVATMGSAKDLVQWAHLYNRVIRFAGAGFEFSATQKASIESYLKDALSKLPLTTRYQWLEKNSIRKLAGASFTAETLAQYAAMAANDGKPSGRADRAKLGATVERILKQTKLKDTFPDAFIMFRAKLADSQNLQPGDVSTIFPEDKRSETERAENLRSQIRGLSALVASARTQPVSEQLKLIDYLMGRETTPPKFIEEAEKDLQRLSKAGVSIVATLRAARTDLQSRSPIERSFVVNSFLAGPNSILEKKEGLETVLSRILSAVSDENRQIARDMAEGLIKAEGMNKSLFISYIFAQKSVGEEGSGASSDNRLTESLVLKSLLDAYGAPTVKLAQYLAFSNEFSAFQKALETYQDAAMPISYYEALLLVNKRLGAKWDSSRYRITRILGSGSVNIAIEYENLETGRMEVLNILRDDIEVKTAEDFRRFTKLMEALTATPESRRKFEFVIGLLDIIKRSVTLEFDKAHSFKIQKGVQELYNRNVNGWNVRTVDAFEIIDKAIRMEKAPGSGAVKIHNKNPEIYDQALGALWQVEYEVLRGVDQSGKPHPVPLLANPDLHDGQVLIDIPNKRVTFIDFGQAVEISNEERELAIDLLRVISNAESVEGAARIMERWSQKLTGKKIKADRAKLKENLARGDRMDVFVHVISQLGREGFDLPLSSIHWVLAANRLIKLGEKIKIPAEKSFRNLVITRKVGLPLTAYNWAKSTYDDVTAKIDSLKSQPVPGLQCSLLFGP